MAISKRESIFSDLTFEVQKLTTAQFTYGKDSPEYTRQHTKSVGVVKELNSLNGHGYASLSKARCALQAEYVAEKGKEQSALKKALKNKREN